tara:strand:- start:336 stop:2072 length:1737 start_codon:yes stop_codon:yes gene_type:complete
MELNLTTSLDSQGQAYGGKDKGTVASRYQQLVTARDPFLQRARDCSKITLPTVVPDSNMGDHGRLKTPYQGVGSRGVNHLTNKLLITLFPPNSPFFKLEIDSLALRVAEAGPEIKTELDTALVKVEHAVMQLLETANGRASMHEAFKHLLIAGNVLLYVGQEGIRVIHLNRYTVVRDPMGTVTEIVVEEECYPEALPEGFLPDEDKVNADKKGPTKKTVKIYTCVKFEDEKCYWYQEAKGKEIPGTYGMCPKDCTPWIPLRFQRVDNEEYGRSYVEQYYSDLTSLESLYQSVLEASAAAAKILFLVNPNGTTRPRTLSSAENGAIIQGNAADVTVIQAQKGQDLQIANNIIDRIESRLQFAFLLNSAIQRPGERVTAEEIRYMSQELEASIGGLYSILTQELQLPLVRRLMYILQKQRKLPDFPKREEDGEPMVIPKPVTGLEAIGRGDDRNKLLDFVTTAQQALGPEVMAQFLNMDELLRRLAASGSIDTTNLVKSEEQLQQEAEEAAQAQQQAQQQQMMSELMTSPAAAQVAKNYTETGAPYGPQFPEGSGHQDPVPNTIPRAIGNPGEPTGPVPE